MPTAQSSQTNWLDDFLGGASDLFGNIAPWLSFIPGIGNSQIGGSIINAGQALRNEGRADQADEQIRLANEQAQGALSNAGFGSGSNLANQAGNYANYGNYLARQNANPTTINSAWTTAFNRPGGIQEGLGGLSSQYTNAATPELEAYRNAAMDVQGRFNSGTQGLQPRYGELGDAIGAGYAATGRESQLRYGSLARNIGGDYSTLGRDMSSGYGGLLSGARGMVNSISDQQTRDVNRRFGEQSASESARLAAQGLGGSTVGSSVRSGIESQRSDELRRVADQTLRERLGVEAQFGSLGLQAEERARMTGLGTQSQLQSQGVQSELMARMAGLGAQQGIGLTGLAEQGANLRYGADLGQAMAGTGLQAGLGVAGSAASLGLNALQQQSANESQRFQAQMGANDDMLNAYLGLGRYPLDMGFNVLNAGLGYYGPNAVVYPAPNNPATIQPHG